MKNLVMNRLAIPSIFVVILMLLAAGGVPVFAKEGSAEGTTGPQAAPVAPWIGIERVPGTNYTLLSWEHLVENDGYEIWRGTTPYFDPDLGEGNQIQYQPKGPGGFITFIDTGVDWYYNPPADPQLPPVQVIGDPATNYFWVVRGRNSDGVSENSNRVGEFDFALVAGS